MAENLDILKIINDELNKENSQNITPDLGSVYDTQEMNIPLDKEEIQRAIDDNLKDLNNNSLISVENESSIDFNRLEIDYDSLGKSLLSGIDEQANKQKEIYNEPIKIELPTPIKSDEDIEAERLFEEQQVLTDVEKEEIKNKETRDKIMSDLQITFEDAVGSIKKGKNLAEDITLTTLEAIAPGVVSSLQGAAGAGVQVYDMVMGFINDGWPAVSDFVNNGGLGGYSNSIEVKYWTKVDSDPNKIELNPAVSLEYTDWFNQHTMEVRNFGLTTQPMIGTLDSGAEPLISIPFLDGISPGMNNLWETHREKTTGLQDPAIKCEQFYLGLNEDFSTNKRVGPIIAGKNPSFLKSYNANVDELLKLKTGPVGSLEILAASTMPEFYPLEIPTEQLNKAIKANNDFTTYHSDTIRRLMYSGPDLFTNMFDVFFITDKDYDKFPTPEKMTEPEHYILTPSVFAVRIKNIKVPFTKKNTFSNNFLGRKIERQGSLVTSDKQSSFTMVADENLYFLDYFNARAGHPNRISVNEKNENSYFTLNHLNNIFPVKWGNKSYEVKDYRNTLLVRSQVLTPIRAGAPGLREDYTKPGNQTLPFFIFEDVKFISSSDVDFNRDSAELLDLNIGFIFRRMVPVNICFGTEDIIDKGKGVAWDAAYDWANYITIPTITGGTTGV